MAQSGTVNITVSSVVGSRGFAQGIADYKRGAPFPDAFDRKTFCSRKNGAGGTWDYERGRLFAAWCAGQCMPVPPLREGRAVSRRTKALLVRALKDGSIT